MFQLLLVPVYPLLVHLAVLRRSSLLAGCALFALAVLMLFKPLSESRRGPWITLLAVTAAIVALVRFGGAQWMLYLPPIALPLMALGAFAVTLLPGRTPMVTLIAATVHRPLPPALVSYTRAVTWMWTLVIALMTAINLVLTFGPRETWSAFTNGGDYLLLFSVFLIEYGVRRAKFGDIDRQSFVDYVRLVLRHRPASFGTTPMPEPGADLSLTSPVPRR